MPVCKLMALSLQQELRHQVRLYKFNGGNFRKVPGICLKISVVLVALWYMSFIQRKASFFLWFVTILLIVFALAIQLTVEPMHLSNSAAMSNGAVTYQSVTS